MDTYVFLSPNQIIKVSDVKAIDKYLNLITSQHKTQPKFKAWLSSALTVVDDNMSTTRVIPLSFDIDTAIGIHLDVIGDIVGRKRVVNFQPSDGSSPMLKDDKYRLILKAKIAQNQWDGTISQIQDLWQTLFPDLLLVLTDNQDMTMDVAVIGLTLPLDKDLITNGYIIAKPQGVKTNSIFYKDAVFAYDLDNAAFKGYDSGYWFQAMPIFAYDFDNDQLKGYDKGAWG